MKEKKANIIDYTYAKDKRKTIMYEDLIHRLEAFPAGRYGIQDAEDLADKVLEQFPYPKDATYVPIVKIANAFQFKTYKSNSLPSDIAGNIFIGGDTKRDYAADKVIIVGSDESLAHQRFIVAHELAHYLIDYIGNEQYKDSSVQFSKAYPKVSHDSPEETRADRFAAELLVPKKLFLKEYKKVMELTGYDKAYAISYLAKIFGVKESCISRRIIEVVG